jgi:hypothetical protein
MTSREATFVMRKAEGRPADSERTGGCASPRAHGQNHRKGDLNEELWKTVLPSHLTPATWKVITLTKGLLAKRATIYLDSHIGKMDTGKQCITN